MFTITFEIKRGDPSVDLINSALSGMKLTGLSIKDSEGYLATTQQFNNEHELLSTVYRYGFDRMQLECAQDEGQKAHTWQIDTEAMPKDEIHDADMYHDLWCATHPDRLMRVLQMISFTDVNAFVVLHHEK